MVCPLYCYTGGVSSTVLSDVQLRWCALSTVTLVVCPLCFVRCVTLSQLRAFFSFLFCQMCNTDVVSCHAVFTGCVSSLLFCQICNTGGVSSLLFCQICNTDVVCPLYCFARCVTLVVCPFYCFARCVTLVARPLVPFFTGGVSLLLFC